MKKKMLILIDTMKPVRDGVSVFLDNSLPFLSEKYDITIIAPDYGEETYENAKLIKFPFYKFGKSDYGPPKVNKKILKREVKKCDFIFNHESVLPFNNSFYGLKYARKYKKPVFTYIHSIDWELTSEILRAPSFVKYFVKKFLILYSRWFLSNCNAIIVPFKTIEEKLKENKINGTFEIIPVGISENFKPGKSNKSFKDKIVMGYSGRLSKEKDLDTLLDAFLKLNLKFDNLQLVLVGDGPDINTVQNKKNVKITGFVSQDEVADYLRAMDIFVLTSVTETSSISTLEAMKTGVCCVTRDVGCIRDYLENGYNGYFFNSKGELMNILEDLIKNVELRKTIGKKAREKVLNYTWEYTANALIKVFDKHYEAERINNQN